MKYCVKYRKDSDFLNKIDEIIIDYKTKSSESLLEFLKAYANKRIIIDIADVNNIKESDLVLISAIHKQYSDLQFTVRIPEYNDFLISNLKEKNIPFFININVNNWDLLYGYSNLGVTDIYVTEILGFEINKVAKVLHGKGIKVRTFPNVCQTAWHEIPSIKTFFIRPEDVKFYEDYIDIFEFYGDDLKKDPVLYSIYTEKQKWFGNLNEIIIDYNGSLDNRAMLPHFGDRRTRCAKACLKGGSCNLCQTVHELSDKLIENNIVLLEEK